jgi:uncharacterized protein (DUF4415 family)
MNENIISRASNDLDEAPVWTEADFDGALHRRAMKPVGRKTKINITLDPDIVAWYKMQSGGRGYQTLINATLREAMRGKQMVEDMRRIIREELKRA